MPNGYGRPRCRQTDIDNEAGTWGFLSKAERALAVDIALGVTKAASGDKIELQLQVSREERTNPEVKIKM